MPIKIIKLLMIELDLLDGKTSGRPQVPRLSLLRLLGRPPSGWLQIHNSSRRLRLLANKPRSGFCHRFTACLADSEQNSCLH